MTNDILKTVEQFEKISTDGSSVSELCLIIRRLIRELDNLQPREPANIVGLFKVVCNTCSCENVEIRHYHNEFEEGNRFVCPKCGKKETL